jgi:uncharacterized phage protein (TIGR02218 family)
MSFSQALGAHLATGLTTVCRCWSLTRRDGLALGFTDHDCDLAFDGLVFAADAGMTAGALQQSTGLAIDNTEAIGALSSAAISEADLAAGRFDGAEVKGWLVNWADTAARTLVFRGVLGDVRRSAGAFHAELRGLAEALNQPHARAYTATCSAILGDRACGVDLSAAGYSVEVPVGTVTGNKVLGFSDFGGFDDRWFERGRVVVVSGAAKGLVGVVKNDRLTADRRVVELWEELRATLAAGDVVRLEAGCDKRSDTCRLKFANFINFRGFPDIPGDDWLMAVPARQAGS